MHQNHRARAEKLSERAYSVEVVTDETTEGMPIYLARILELEGCMAQGETIEQALENLKEAKLDFIESLLEDGLPVPSPSLMVTSTSSTTSATFTLTNRQEEPSRVYTAVLITP